MMTFPRAMVTSSTAREPRAGTKHVTLPRGARVIPAVAELSPTQHPYHAVQPGSAWLGTDAAVELPVVVPTDCAWVWRASSALSALAARAMVVIDRSMAGSPRENCSSIDMERTVTVPAESRLSSNHRARTESLSRLTRSAHRSLNGRFHHARQQGGNDGAAIPRAIPHEALACFGPTAGL